MIISMKKKIWKENTNDQFDNVQLHYYLKIKMILIVHASLMLWFFLIKQCLNDLNVGLYDFRWTYCYG